MLAYREMEITEAERIAQIDAANYIENAWRRDASGNYRLVRIDWTGGELPNGYAWHLRRFRETLSNGGTVFGCFEGDTLVGYAAVNGTVFGGQRYVLLDQLFVSNRYRGQGIGGTLFRLCAEQAGTLGARKLYLCAASAEKTITFYHKLGCVPAVEPDRRLMEEDINDIQLEYALGEK